MSANGVTELIWHFAGYLHMPQDVVLARVAYQEGAVFRSSDTYSARMLRERPTEVEIEDSGTVRTRLEPTLEGIHASDKIALLKSLATAHAIPAHAAFSPLATAKAFVPAEFGSDLSGEPIIVHPPADYSGGGDDKLIELEQTNWLSDNDTVFDGTGNWTTADVLPILEDMIEQAAAKVPEELRLPDTDTSSITAFISDRNADRADDGPLDYQVGPGRYVNGEFTTEERPERPSTEEETPDGTPKTATAEIHNNWQVGQEVDLGSNQATNEAVIVDTNETSAGLVVMGDYFSLNAIIQVNIYQDHDTIRLQNGTGGNTTATLASAEGMGNTAVNDAEFLVEEINYNPPDRGHGPVQWNIDMVHGDFFDVKSLRQTNYMLDNDVSSLTSVDIYSSVRTGGNEQTNQAQFWDMAKSYDLIIVGGSFHHANLIYQTNILLDDDLVELYAQDRGIGLGSAVAQSVRAGENSLLNEALIRNIGTHKFSDITPDIQALVDAIQAQSSYLDPNLAWDLLGGSGKLDVLYVSGDYYDINVISQVNVMSDRDVAIANSQAGVISQDSVSQSATTGGNELTNSASIVDVGTVSDIQYLGGELYEDTILIQAEIVTNNDNDNVMYGDTNALAPEIAAFVGDDVGVDNGDTLLTYPTTAPAHGDVMGGVLT